MSRDSLLILCATGIALILICGSYFLWHQQKEIQALTLEAAVAGTGDASLVAEWTPIVVQVDCSWKDSSQDGGGSGILLKRSNGNFYILTNAHVVTDNTGKRIAQSCDTVFPDAVSTTYTVDHKNITTDPNGADASLLQLPEDSYLTGLVSTNQRKICTTPPAIGDDMLLLGYPDAGSSNGITVTDGIVAGDEGYDYVSSAKIDGGDSGGAAIDVKNDCYFGIPSYTIDGDYTNLARVLKWGTMFIDDPGKLSEARL
ncbi:MAG: serine protease [Minisyncoccia bacterium]|jgi:S1-C subfamily serine protease